jgi:uncharacterized protein (UPF0548 family)
MSEGERRTILAQFGTATLQVPHFLTLDGTIAPSPPGYVRDRSCTTIGVGPRDFATARDAMQRWRQFDLGWVSFADSGAPMVPGQIVGVEALAAGLWTFNVCRIVEIADEAERFGFVYATTEHHVEQGEERFVIELDSKTQVVSYRIEAVSRPHHLLVWLAYPFARAMQRRFARDSANQMRAAVSSRTSSK